MKKYLYLLVFSFCLYNSSYSQSNLVDFNSIPATGTIMVFAHQDDDAIWMLPWWNKTQKFICAAMPSTPTYKATIDDQQIFLDNNAYGIDYKSNWIHPWSDITQEEYVQYYWNHDFENYGYLVNDHLSYENYSFSRTEINKIKAKIEPYIADTATKRIITHNNWGEYGHTDHKAVNQAVRELAVKYGKDVWILGSEIIDHQFNDISVPAGINYSLGDFDAGTPLYNGIRDAYVRHEAWTWESTNTTGSHKFIQIVNAGVDKSDILVPGTVVTTTGAAQNKPGAYIFNGIEDNSDYLTLQGNNDAAFTIAMWVRPDIIQAMDISKMSEYPSFITANRTFYMQSDGKVTARVSDGNSSTHTITSLTALSAGNWTHILMISDGTNLQLFVDGISQGPPSTGITISGYTTPEFILGQKQETNKNFKGQIADVRLYDKVLTESSILSLISSTPTATHTTTATAGGGGTISPMGTLNNLDGESRTYTITPNANYSTNVKIDGVSVGAITSYTFSNITTNHTIDATFTLLPGIALNKPTTAQSSSSVIHTANKANDSDGTNASYWEADSYPQWWQVDLQGIYDVSTIVVKNYYDLYRYYKYEIWGSLDNITFTKIAEKTDTKFSGESGDTFNLTSTTARFLKVIMTNNSFSNSVQISDFRVFGIENSSTHFIDASAGAGGTITPVNTSVFSNGANQTYTITANAYNQVADVKVDGVSIGALPGNTLTTSYSFSNITADHTIEAIFSPLQGIALNKPTSSQSFTSVMNTPNKANDGDGTNGSYWEATPFEQWWQVDLQNIYDISAVLIRNYHEALRYYQYEIWGSLDNLSFTKIAEKKNNNTTTDAGDLYDLTATTITARYIKVIMTSNSFNNSVHISDFKVYGTLSSAYHLINASASAGGTITFVGSEIVSNGTSKVYTITPNANYGVSDVIVDGISVGAVTSYEFTNITISHTIEATFAPLAGIALNKPVTAQSFTSVTNTPNKANDADDTNNSYWEASPYQQWWQVDLQGIYDINEVLIRNYYETGRYYQYEIWGSLDNINFTKIAEKSDTNPTTDDGDIYPLNTTARFLKVIMINNSANTAVHISDFRVYGTENSTTHFVEALASAGGSITPDSTKIFSSGANQTYTITANTYYQIADIKVDGVSIEILPENKLATSYLFSNISANHTIDAVFSPQPGIALNKPATAESTLQESTSPSKANDSDGTNSSYWEANQFPQWWQVDLQNFYDISAVLIRNYLEALRFYQYEIWGSLDNVSFTKIAEKKNNNTTTDVGDLYDLTATTITARYIKVIMTSNSFNNSVHISDFRVYGTLSNAYHIINASTSVGGTISFVGTKIVGNGTAKTYMITPNANYNIADVKVDGVSVGVVTSYEFSNITADHSIEITFAPLAGIALNKPVTAQSFTSVTNSPEKANDADGTNGSYWEASPYQQWWQVDLQGIYDVNGVFIRNYFETGRYYQYEIWGSIDNVNFSKIAEKSDINPTTGAGVMYALNTTARFLKVIMIKNSANTAVHISDFRVYGTENSSIHYIEASADAGGTITPDSTKVFSSGVNQTYTITANAYYQIDDIKVDGVSIEILPENKLTTSYTFSNISANHTIEAVFSPQPGIALNKPATAGSTIQESTSPSKANDSDRTNSSYWEASQFPQWWQVDLQNFYDISAVLIRNFNEALRYYQYEIWGSLDNLSFTKIAEKKNNNTTTDAGDLYDLTATTITARYIKVIMTNNSVNNSVHISDFRVYGTPSNAYHLINASTSAGGSITFVGTTIVPTGTAKTYTITPDANYGVSDVKVDGVSVGAPTSYQFTNITADHTIESTFTLLPGIALNKPSACQSFESGGNGPEKANDADGTNNSYWSAISYPQWWQVDLQSNYNVSAVYIRNFYNGDGRSYQYEILGSTDNVNFSKIAEKTSSNPSTDAGDLYNLTTTARYIKVIMKNNSLNSSVHITDFRVFATQNKMLNLSSVMLEGLYDGNSTMRQAQDDTGAHWPIGVADHITVELHDAANYSNIVYTATDVPLSTTGNAEVTVPGAFSGNYYVTIKHRNSIETTSATPISFANNSVSKSFGSTNDVYGGNLVQMVDGHFAIYCGDVNQDGLIDTSDMSIVENDNSMASMGYLFDDCNGDGLIDTSDMTIVENNNNFAIGVFLP